MISTHTPPGHNVNPDEIEKFGALAERWWDPTGEFRALHAVNPLRIQFLLQHAGVSRKRVLDVGCGGGILSEGLARLGGEVTGIDMSREVLEVAELHSLESRVPVSYEKISVEELAEREPQGFDIVTCMEMLEHVPDPASVVNACARLAKPSGQLFFSTLNRNPRAYLLAILGAEYLLKMIPKGTHDYKSFIRPSELAAMARSAGLTLQEMAGIEYHPLEGEFHLGSDIHVNFLATFSKPPE